MYTIENNLLKATFQPRCGELSSLINKITGTEHIWSANPDIWAWHAPILFPIVGSVKDDTLFAEGKSFFLSRHGFFRNSTPIVENHTETSITFLLLSDAQTLEVYPYEFEFRVRFTVLENSLKQEFLVKNTDSKRIYFALGGHPAFAVPFKENESYSDYYLEFEHAERLDRSMLSSKGLFTEVTEPVLVSGNIIPLSYSLFDNDAIVLKSIESRSVTIRSKTNMSSLKVDFKDFPYLGLWAKPNANFVCIEPWIGCADSEKGHADIREKELVQDLLPDEDFLASFTISVN
ncbi:MAG: aldose 1-epimerase family protein [Cyanobacteria bacterium]|nr:aldose 1-epimerase family protein [Cyanobacteria bacterium CG_2015-09_32_10]